MVEKIVCELVRREVTVGSRRCQAGRQADPICGHLGPDPGKRPAGVRWRTPGKTVSPVRRIAL